MGIRRRRRRLTTLMSQLDQRVRSVELRPVNLLTSGQIDAAIEIGEVATGPETVVSSSAPYQFRRIEDAYIYPKALTGLNEDRVEIYLESDLSVAVGDRIEVSGIHGTSTEDIDVDGDNFTVRYLDTPPWDDRESYKHDPTADQRSGVTISNTYSFKPETVAPPTWSTRKRLQTRRLVDTFSITGTTVTLTMNATHKFQVGNVIYVDIFSENSTAFGADGLFEVTGVTSDTIEYELSAGVVTPTGTLTPTGDVYVFPVAREWAQDGSIWIDSSSNTTYYWDGLRWVEYTPEVAIGADGDPPAPPTGFSITSVASTFGPYSTAYSKVTLSWTPPTLTSEGDTLTDLLGYKIQWRDSPSAQWKEMLVNNPTLSSYVFDQEVNLQQGTTYYFRLYAYDSGNQDSTAATATHTTTIKAGDHTTYPPTDPIATSRLGTIKVEWDGRLKTGPTTSIAAPSDISVLRIYVSTTPSFTPSASNLAKSTRVFGSDGGFDVLTDLTYGVSYYIKIKVADTAGVESAASAQVTAQVTPLVDTDLIEGTLSTWPFNGGTVPAGALASGAINASNMFGNDVVVQSAIAANAIGANEIAAGAVIAGKIGASAVTAGTIDALAISAGNIQTNAITAAKISAGAITAVKIATDAITAEKIEAGAITAAKIAATTITADKFAATLAMASNMIIQDADPSLGRIELRGNSALGPRGIVAFKNSGGGVSNAAFRFYTNGDTFLDDVEVSGTMAVSGSVTGGTFTGGTFRTSSGTNGRVNISSSATYGTTGAVNFETYNTYLRGQSTPYFNTTVALGTYASGQPIANTAYIHRLDGSIRNTSTVSDARLKEQVETLSLGLNFIKELRPVKFVWKQDHKNAENWGFIAQEGRRALEANGVDLDNNPVAGLDASRPVDGENGREASYTFKDSKLIPVLVQAIKDLSAQVDELSAKIEYLESK